MKVDVRYDPFDITVAYAYVNGEWVTCRAKRLWELEMLEGRSEKELANATDEIKKMNKLQGKTFVDITDRKLAEFFQHIEMEETALSAVWRQAKKNTAIQHLRDVERKLVHALIDECDVQPDTRHLQKLLNLSILESENPLSAELSSSKDFITAAIDDAFDDDDEFDSDDSPESLQPLEVW